MLLRHGPVALTILIVIAWLDPCRLGALNPQEALSQYTRTVWTQEQGLPQDTIRAIAQTGDGYLWLGTNEGLVRFDGYDFVTFTKDDGSLPNNSVTALRTGANGRLWIGTPGGLTSYFQGQFKIYTTRDGLPTGTVNGLVEDHAGVLWMIVGGGLSRFENGKFATYSKKELAPLESVSVVYEDRQQQLWIGGVKGVLKRQGDKFSLVLGAMDLEGNIVTAILKDAKGLWAAGTRGIILIPPDGRLRRFTTREGLPNDLVRALYEDRAGNLWVGTTLFRGLRPEKGAPAGQLTVSCCGAARLRLCFEIMPDELSTLYSELLEGSYDCVDRIILNAYFPMGINGGGMRCWWRALHGSDEGLDNAHLMRIAGRFSRRLRAWAKDNHVPVEDCPPGDRKHEIAQEYLATHEARNGLFLILVSRSPALVWDVQMSGTGKIGNITKKEPRPYVNHYHFHILDPDWGHITIKMSGHPPFGAQVMLNGHEYVACQARKEKVEFAKEGNCFIHTPDAAGLARVADTLSEPRTAGRLREVCERWIYNTCLLFALDLEEQKRSAFEYKYSIYQIEYSRNFLFQSGAAMEQVFQSLIDRTRAPLGLDRVKTIFGNRKRPCRRKLRAGRYGVVVETPAYDLTVFKVHYGKLTLKIYTKGERVLRIEVIVHNARELSCGRSLPNFPVMVEMLRGMLQRFLNALHCMDRCFIADDLLERLPAPSQVGKAKVGGVDYNQSRMRVAMRASLALATAPKGFTASDLARKVADLNPAKDGSYTPRQAAYDLKKLRGKQLIDRIGSSHRYRPSDKGLRAMTALVVLRDKVIKPLLASCCQRKRGRKPKNVRPLDVHYEQLQAGMRKLFDELGVAA